MAMYYYASKISAVACGTRCKQQNSFHRSSRNHKDRYKEKGNSNENDDDDDEKMVKIFNKASLENEAQTISGSSKELPEVACNDIPMVDITDAVLGSNGVMYKNGNIVSGPLEPLIELLMPINLEDFDREYIFSFLLSSRLFIRPHELLGKLLSTVPDNEPLDRIVELLKIWTKTFPYDFRDERIMCHVKHIVARCADTDLGDVVSELLRALLNRLTDLERHEEDLRAYQTTSSKTEEPIKWPSASQLAQLLCRIERKLAKHVGPEEFIQCNSSILTDRHISKTNSTDTTPTTQHQIPTTSSSTCTSSSALNPKKTCNLESYLEWSARLRLLVANEILQCTGIRERSKIVEMWSGAAQYCLLVGNYNSATAILESLDTPPIARLKLTWSKLSTTCQQLDCMQRHAEGCGDLWNKQTISCNFPNNTIEKHKTKSKPPSEWVVIPIFSDIVRLALTAREDCSTKLPNGHVHVAAFDRISAIVGAFTKHMCEVNTTLPDVGEYESLCRHMQSCSLISESELMLASFDCEEPSSAEKKEYGVA